MRSESDIIYGQISLETQNRESLDSNMEIRGSNFQLNKPFISEGIKEVTKMTDHTSHYMKSLHNSIGQERNPRCYSSREVPIANRENSGTRNKIYCNHIM
jgi:hypothetical protein